MDTKQQIEQVVKALQSGGVIAYPTESVFGLGCDPDNEAAIRKILKFKNRPPAKGLILVAASFQQLEKYLQRLAPDIESRVLRTWPGPCTWLWPVKEGVSELIRGQHQTLAVRVSDHPVVKELCQRYGKAIVSTSANPADMPPARSAKEVRTYFGDKLDFILDAELGNLLRPTEIRDALSNQVVRPA